MLVPGYEHDDNWKRQYFVRDNRQGARRLSDRLLLMQNTL